MEGSGPLARQVALKFLFAAELEELNASRFDFGIKQIACHGRAVMRGGTVLDMLREGQVGREYDLPSSRP